MFSYVFMGEKKKSSIYPAEFQLLQWYMVCEQNESGYPSSLLVCVVLLRFKIMHLMLDIQFCCNSTFINISSTQPSEVHMCEKSKIQTSEVLSCYCRCMFDDGKEEKKKTTPICQDKIGIKVVLELPYNCQIYSFNSHKFFCSTYDWRHLLGKFLNSV